MALHEEEKAKLHGPGHDTTTAAGAGGAAPTTSGGGLSTPPPAKKKRNEKKQKEAIERVTNLCHDLSKEQAEALLVEKDWDVDAAV